MPVLFSIEVLIFGSNIFVCVILYCQKMKSTQTYFVRAIYDLDPNYLVDDQLPHSPFHQGLHKFVKNNLTEDAQVGMDGLITNN